MSDIYKKNKIILPTDVKGSKLKLREVLDRYTKQELKMICVNLNIPGYGKLDKTGLIERIHQSINNKEFVIDLMESLTDLCVYFLSLIPKIGQEERNLNANSSNIQSFSMQTFNNILKKFHTINYIFMGEDIKGNGILVIPEDISPWFKDFLEKNQNTLASKLGEIEKNLLQQNI